MPDRPGYQLVCQKMLFHPLLCVSGSVSNHGTGLTERFAGEVQACRGGSPPVGKAPFRRVTIGANRSGRGIGSGWKSACTDMLLIFGIVIGHAVTIRALAGLKRGIEIGKAMDRNFELNRAG